MFNRVSSCNYAVSVVTILILAGCGGGSGSDISATELTTGSQAPAGGTPTNSGPPTTPTDNGATPTAPVTPTPGNPDVIPDSTTATPLTGLTASCTTQSTPTGLGTQTTRTNCLHFNTMLSQIIPGFYIGTPDRKLEPNSTATQCTVRVRQNGGVEIRSGTATRIVEPALQSGAPADAVWNTLSDTITQAQGYSTQTYSVYNRVNGTFAKIYWSEFVKGRNVFAGRISMTEDVQETGCLDIKPFDFGPPEERYGAAPGAAYQTCTVERDGTDLLVNECTQFTQYTPNIVFGRYRGSTLSANPEECVVSVHRQFGIEIDIPVSPGSETMKSRNMVGLLRPDGMFSDQWTYLLNQTNPQQEAIGISNSRVRKEALFIWNPTLPGAARAVASITDSVPGTGEPQVCGDLSLISRY
ncbi:hypothetical protein RY831_03845 [Noviherbaspirillum sp. CPCC 100848]|uniref:Uncharacterized protein n=1 Tax=Noviherbaspirillum album TaxID=3080276 RepID=A0ABU6J3R5_9BURK|nr:hypothetical protein [Noviherbaspirillum sp. CPCC 100848]MEC4718267.1 hypothetical protein [Noviherbaspirillum sp. CPCC 100848]